MVYVNKIADYIHVAVSDNDGHPNKNIGDAFQVSNLACCTYSL